MRCDPPTLTDLAHLPVWVAWREEQRNGRKTKVPYDPIRGVMAESNDPDTWATYGEAETWAISHCGNIGMMFSPIKDGVHTGGIDLDSCRDPQTEQIAPWAQHVINRFRSYTEVSPSQTGVKVFFTYPAADKPKLFEIFGNREGRSFKPANGADHPPGIEVYIGRRYFAVTGEEIGGYPHLRCVSIDDLRWVVEVVGPSFVGAGSDKGKDNSRSGKAFRQMAELKRAGLSYEQARDALVAGANSEIAEWAREKGMPNGEREMRRAYEGCGANFRKSM